jgi:hypothetical protein
MAAPSPAVDQLDARAVRFADREHRTVSETVHAWVSRTGYRKPEGA